jgi:hypothetical protein
MVGSTLLRLTSSILIISTTFAAASTMSQPAAGMGGFAWPIAVNGSTPSNTTVSASSPSVSSSVMTSTAPHTGVFFSSAPLATETASDSGVYFSSVPSVTSTASSVFFSPGMPTGSPRTTTIQITTTVTVTPTVSSGVPITTGGPRTTTIQITKTTTVTPTISHIETASATTGTHSHAPAETCTHTHQFLTETSLPQFPDVSGLFPFKGRQLASSSSTPTNQVPIIVGIVGAIVAAILLVLLARYCSNRPKSKPSDIEHGRWPASRRIYPYSPEVPSRGSALHHASSPQSQNRDFPLTQMSESQVLDPVGFAHANNFQNGLGIQDYQYGSRGRAARPVSTASSFGGSPWALAQAHAWDTPFAADNFQPTPTFGGSFRQPPPQFEPFVPAPRFPTAMPTRKPVPPPRSERHQRPVAAMPSVFYDTRQADRARSVSPLAEDEARYLRHGSQDYSDVSPIISPPHSPRRMV